MRTAFIDAVRTCLKAGGFSRKDNEQESGGTFLVGVVGRLFRVDCDYQVGETLCGYDAVGSGEGIACGSLHTSAALDMEPEARVTAALSAAAEHSAGVRPPFNLVWEPRSAERRNAR